MGQCITSINCGNICKYKFKNMKMEKLSTIAWQKSLPVITAIQGHPFNAELASGTLAIDKFAYYIEQDTLYLRDFARALAIIAARAPLQFVRAFLGFAEGALIAEQEVVHNFFRETFNFESRDF